MLYFIAILGALLVFPDLFIYFTYLSKLECKAFYKLSFFLPSLLIIGSWLYIGLFGDRSNIHFMSTFVAWFAFFMLLIIVPKMMFSLLAWIDIPLVKWFQISTKPFTYLGVFVGLMSAGILLYGAIWGKTQFEVKKQIIYSDALPAAFDGYRMVQLSDLHIGNWNNNHAAISRAFQLVNAQHPDIIVLTGDLVNNVSWELDGWDSVMKQLKAKDGIYSVLGNHDYGAYYSWKNKAEQEANMVDLKKRQASFGFQMLNNESHLIQKEGAHIALLGVENWGKPPFAQYGDLSKALAGVDSSLFKILLSHDPSHWRGQVLPQTTIQLMLAGHTHASQLKLFKHSFSSFMYKEWSGLYQQVNQFLYVNEGLGFVGPPFRFGAWPEITVIELRCKKGV